MESDRELLRRYAAHGDDAAFREIVLRYIGLVYSSARRQVGDAHWAEDVTQMVFTRLASKAKGLRDDSVLAGWLYADTRLTALQLLRQERRRKKREEEFMAAPGGETPWKDVAPLIDEALNHLPPGERDAILLRVLQGQSFEQVGSSLGLGADAARMRVNRALDKLKGWLQRHGVKSTSAALGALLASNGIEHTPSALAAIVAAQASAGAMGAMGAMGSGTQVIGGLIMAKTKLVVGAALIIGLATPLLWQKRTNDSLRQRSVMLEEQVRALQSEQREAQGNARMLSAEAATVPGLRAEIARLRGELDRAKALQARSSPTPKESPLATRETPPPEPVAPLTDADVAEFLARPAQEQGRLFGGMRAAGFSRGIDNVPDYDRQRQLAQRTRPQLEELERKPEDYAAFQTEFIKALTGVTDETKVNQIHDLLHKTYQQAVAEGLDAPSKPQDNAQEWLLKRDALDRPATRAVEAMLTEEERSKMGHALLGVMGIDLGFGDGGWHRINSPDGRGYTFPSERARANAE